jgi:hypothetical protein
VLQPCTHGQVWKVGKIAGRNLGDCSELSWPIAGTGSLQDVAIAHILTQGRSWEVLQGHWRARAVWEREQRQRIERPKKRKARPGRDETVVPQGTVSPVDAHTAQAAADGVAPGTQAESISCSCDVEAGATAASAVAAVTPLAASAEQLAAAGHASDVDVARNEDPVTAPISGTKRRAGKQRAGDGREAAGKRVANRAAATSAKARRAVGSRTARAATNRGGRKGQNTKGKKGTHVGVAEDEASVCSHSRSLSSVSENESSESELYAESRVGGKRHRETASQDSEVRLNTPPDGVPVVERAETPGSLLAHSDSVGVSVTSVNEVQPTQEGSSGSHSAVGSGGAVDGGEGAVGRDSDPQRAVHVMSNDAECTAHSHTVGLPSYSVPATPLPASARSVASLSARVVTAETPENPRQQSNTESASVPTADHRSVSSSVATFGAVPHAEGAQGVKRKIEAQIMGVLEAQSKLHNVTETAAVKKMKADLESRLESLSHALHRLAAKEDAELLREAEQYL